MGGALGGWESWRCSDPQAAAATALSTNDLTHFLTWT